MNITPEEITPEEIGIVDRDTTTVEAQRWTDLANADQLDNPTEWEAIVGAAIIDPSKTAEMKRKAAVKLAVEARWFCDCGKILDQQTAIGLVDAKGNVRNVSCPACMVKELRKSLRKMTERYGAEHTRETITQDFTLISWTGTITGAEIWSTYSQPAPPRPKKPKPDRWMTPAQLEADCHGWTPGATLVIAGPYIMQPDKAGRRKLEKRAPDGIQNHEHFSRLIATAEHWLAMTVGSKLTQGAIVDNDGRTMTELLCDDGSIYCRLDTIRMRTVEHYCGAGAWYESPTSDKMKSPRYCHTPHAACALCASMTDN